MNDYDLITKRDIFSAHAMQGLLASGAPGIKTKHGNPGTDVTAKLIAQVSVECADELLKELYKERKNVRTKKSRR